MSTAPRPDAAPERPGAATLARDLAPASAPIAPETASGAEGAERAGARVMALRLGAVLVLLALDLWSKARVFAWLGQASLVADPCDFPHLRRPLIGEWFAFMLSTNKGAAFGKLDSVPYLLVGGRLLAVVLLLHWLWRTPAHRRVLGLALTLVLAGALGNLYDNLALDPPSSDPEHPFGYVRDFVDVYFGAWQWHFPTFNVADSCITVGAALLLATGLWGERGERARLDHSPRAA